MVTTALTVPASLDEAARRWPSDLAILDGDVHLTWYQLRVAAHRAAGGLVRRGVRPGDRIAIQAPNSWGWVVAALAIHIAGGVLVPINTRYKGDETRDLVARAHVRFLFTVTDFLGLDYVAMLDRPDVPTVRLDAELDELMAEGDEVSLDSHVQPTDLSDILFTSGTTGRPKGVMCTHAQTVRVFRTWAETVGIVQQDRYLVVAPFFHSFGYKAGLVACVLTGATIVPQAVFDAEQVAARLASDRITVLPGPPALYMSLLQRGGLGSGPTNLRLAVTGAASVPEVLVRRMHDELGFQTVLTAYGLTESCGVVTMCRAGDDPTTISQTSGRAIPGVAVRVVDPSGADVLPGEPGEVWVRGYNVMKGYLDDPGATADAIVDGWLRTGDIGVLDTRGYLRITDRLKDMFIHGGFNVYPAEVENKLMEHPGVAEVAVIGVPNDRMGEEGCAFVVSGGVPVTGSELTAWAREHMANFKVPRTFRFVDALPRNATGKVAKDALRALTALP